MSTTTTTVPDLNKKENKNFFINNETPKSAGPNINSKHPARMPEQVIEANLPIDNLLMKELLKQQNKYMEAQKNIYELQKEIDVEEVKSRYQALDLNNAQIKVEELTAELENMEHLYKKTRRENWIGRGVSILYLIYLIFYNIYFA